MKAVACLWLRDEAQKSIFISLRVQNGFVVLMFSTKYKIFSLQDFDLKKNHLCIRLTIMS